MLRWKNEVLRQRGEVGLMRVGVEIGNGRLGDK